MPSIFWLSLVIRSLFVTCAFDHSSFHDLLLQNWVLIKFFAVKPGDFLDFSLFIGLCLRILNSSDLLSFKHEVIVLARAFFLRMWWCYICQHWKLRCLGCLYRAANNPHCVVEFRVHPSHVCTVDPHRGSIFSCAINTSLCSCPEH